jgi:hypothetical protein
MQLHRAQEQVHERALAMQRKAFEQERLEHELEEVESLNRRKDEFLAISATQSTAAAATRRRNRRED